MSGKFASSFAKIDRARKTIAELRERIKLFNETKPYQIKNELNAATGENVLVYYPTSDIPTVWLVMIGEIIHQLRSSLDLAIFELTHIETGTQLKNTEFPVFEDKGIFLERKKDGQPTSRSGLFKIRGLRQKTVELIEEMQPYNLRNRRQGEVPFLSLLHEMDIIDKHRKLHLCRRLAISSEVKFIRDVPGVVSVGIEIGADLDKQAIIARLQLMEPKYEDYLGADLLIEIAFDEKSYPEFKKPEEIFKVLNLLESGVVRTLELLRLSLN